MQIMYFLSNNYACPCLFSPIIKVLPYHRYYAEKGESLCIADDSIAVLDDGHDRDASNWFRRFPFSPEVLCHLSWWLQSYLPKVNVMSGLWLIEVDGVELCFRPLSSLFRRVGLVLRPFCGQLRCLQGRRIGILVSAGQLPACRR